MRMQPAVIAFDAYGTLCSITHPREPYRQLFGLLNIEPKVGGPLVMRRNEDFVTLAHTLAPDIPIDVDPLLGALHDELDSIQLFPEVASTLAQLVQRGFKLCLISNLAQPYTQLLRQLLEPWIETFIFSCEVGLLKPEPEIFYYAAQLVGCPPERMLMVGDNLKYDVQGAQAAGMQAIYLNRSQRPLPPITNPPLMIRSLDELLTVL
jgi:HAD superfamily hydrolase (TIGR01493 family)